MAALDLVSAADVRTYAGWDTSTPPADWISDAITAVSMRFETAVDRHTKQESRTEYFDVQPGEMLRFRVRGYPVTAMDVYHDTDRDFGAATELDDDTYYFNTATGRIDIDGVTLTPAPGALKVTYTGGMATSTANFKTAFPDIHQAILKQLVFDWKGHDRIGQAAAQGPDGSVTISAPDDWVQTAKEIIDKYRRRSIL